MVARGGNIACWRAFASWIGVLTLLLLTHIACNEREGDVGLTASCTCGSEARNCSTPFFSLLRLGHLIKHALH